MRILDGTIIVAALLAGCRATGTLNSDLPQNASARSEAPGAYDRYGDAYDRYAYDTRIDIPDGDPVGVLIGPVQTPENGSLIGQIVLALDMSHSYTADVMVELCYDVDNDGQVEVRVPVDLFRARADAFASREKLAVPMQLAGRSFFRDDNPVEAENWEKANSGIPADSTLASSRAFSVFRGLRLGGSFYLAVADTSRQNAGSVNAWSVLTQNTEPGLAQQTPHHDE